MKKKTGEWNEELSTKLNDLRDQKKRWMAEANTLRSKNVDLEVLSSFGLLKNDYLI